MAKRHLASTLALIASCSFFAVACGHKTETSAAGGEAETKSVAAITGDAHSKAGLFNLYQDKATGSLHLALKPDQLDVDVVHYMQVTNGPGSVGDFGQFVGAYHQPQVIRFERHFDKIHIRQENTVFTFDDNNAVSRASRANINRPLLASLKIEAEDKESGALYINVDSLFLSEALSQLKPSPDPEAKPGQKLTLGKLNNDKTRFVALHNYPENTDVVVEYVYENPEPILPKEYGLNITDYAVGDPRSLALSVRHSLIQVPESDFQPRRDDPRLGYFSALKQDMTAGTVAPYGDLIQRWHLVKQDPSAALSEPVEPIVWWIENTTPLEYRDTIRDATLAWNQAFEQAGFKNAIQVKVQPDDAEWDAGDLRYNVLRWTASPKPLFGGYGPSVANPLTGQILGADIMLELVAMQMRSVESRLFDLPTANAASGALPTHDHSALYAGGALGFAALSAANVEANTLDRYSEEFLYFLILHEVGHTLGLNHNFIASQMTSLADVFNPTKTRDGGLLASVMDYPAPNLAPHGESHGQFYTVQPGAYDRWAIEYGYSPAVDDPEQEATRLAAILARSSDPALAFANDADDMRAPGAGIDPRINIWDMSDDAIGYSEIQFQRSQQMLDTMTDKLLVEGESRQELVHAAGLAMNYYGRAAQTVSRYVGGVMTDRTMVGQREDQTPFTPVSLTEQKRAMDVLSRYVFAPEALRTSPELLRQLQQQRRWFFFYGKTEDPKVHDHKLAIQKVVLDHLLHPVVHKRIQDSSLYGNQYSLTELYGDLNAAIFAADAKGNVNSFRQALQREYVDRLIASLSAKGDATLQQSQALARYSLKRVEEALDTRGNDAGSQAHKEQLIFLIKQATNPQAGASSA